MQEKTPFGWIFRIFNEQKPSKDINMKKSIGFFTGPNLVLSPRARLSHILRRKSVVNSDSALLRNSPEFTFAPLCEQQDFM